MRVIARASKCTHIRRFIVSRVATRAESHSYLYIYMHIASAIVISSIDGTRRKFISASRYVEIFSLRRQELCNFFFRAHACALYVV